MPAKNDHIAKADHDKGVMPYLLGWDSECADWVVICAFYRAVHLVDALLASDPGNTAQRHPHDHTARELVLKQNRYEAI